MKTIFLIRHGATEWTETYRYCGWNDIPLSEGGQAQALCLRARLEEEPVDCVWHSPLQRAQQTAAIALPQKPLRVHPGLQEMNFGAFSGLTYEELMERYPVLYPQWLDNPVENTPPGGESIHTFAQRVRSAWSDLLQWECLRGRSEHTTSAVVTHGGVIRIILADMKELPLSRLWEIQQDLTAVNRLECTGTDLQIMVENDTEHLTAARTI
jgi:alpha-ribazole phosphatase